MRAGKKRARPKPASAAASASAFKTNYADPNATCVDNNEEFFSPASSSNEMKLSGEKGVEKHATPATAMCSPADTIAGSALVSPAGPCVREVPPTPPSAATAGGHACAHWDDGPTDTQSLQHTFVELEKKWKRSNEDAATATVGASRKSRRAQAPPTKKVAVTQTVPQQSQRTETPSTAPSTAIPNVIDVQVRRHDGADDGSVGMRSPRPQQQRGRRRKPSVFERLSQQTTASSRRKRRVAGDDRSECHQDSVTPRSTQSLYSPSGTRNRAAAQGKSFDTACSLSTLSCADSVFDRLYRNEPRPRRKHPHRTPRSSASCAWTIGEGDFEEEEADAFSAAQARVERRLTYTPNVRVRTKRQQQQQQQQRSLPAKNGNGKQQSARDEVHNRLYRNGIRAQDSRARSEVERLEHRYEDDDVETFYSSRSRPTSPSKTSVRKPREMSTFSDDARTQTLSKKETSCSPIEVLEIVNDGIDWDISCIEEATSNSISKGDDAENGEGHDDNDDDDDLGDESDDDCLQDAKQLIDDSVELIDNFLNATNQLIEESFAEMMEEAEVSAISERADNTTFATVKEEVSQFTKEKLESSILIQKVCRGFITRRKVEGLKDQSASIVPALVESALHSKKPSNARGDLITKYYLRERCKLDDGTTAIPLQRLWQGEEASPNISEATIVIQRRWRSHRAKCSFISQRRQCRAAIVIQRKWRAHRAVKQFDKLICSAVMLQAWSRGVMALRLRKVQMEAVLLIQRSWRQAAQANADRRACIIKIQTQWRTYRARRDLCASRSSIILVQSIARQLLERKRFRTFVQASVASALIQRISRGHSARVQFRTVIDGVVRLQRLYRAQKARRFVEDKRRALLAATAIQGWYRRQLSMVSTTRMNVAATMIQRSYRRYSCRKSFRSTVRGVVMVQALFRRVRALRAMERQFQAAVSIQAHFRGYYARRTHQKAISTIILLQGLARSFLALRSLTRSRKAAIIIQQAWKDKSAKEAAQHHSEAACTLIQTAWRSYYHRHNFLLYRSCGIILQSLFRQRMAVQELKMRKREVLAIAKLQAIQRGIQIRRGMSERVGAAASIQRMWRGAVFRKEYQICLRSAKIIQSYARVLLAKQSAMNRRNAATSINASARMWLVLKRLACNRDNSIVIQRIWRGEQSRRIAVHRIGAIVVIQASLRRHRDRRDYQKIRSRVISLQSMARGQLGRALLKRRHQAASTIQRAWRKYCQFSHNRLIDVVVKMQSALRSYACRRRYCTVKNASIAIQALARGSFARAQSRRVLNAVLCIQSICRRHLAKACISRQCAAATLIQSLCRSHHQRSKYAGIICSTIALQARYRGIKGRNEYQQIRAVERERRVKAQVEVEVEADIEAIMSANQSVAKEFVAFGPCVRKLTLQLYASQARAAALDSPRSKVLQSAGLKRADVPTVDQASQARGGMKDMVDEEQKKRDHLAAIERSNQGATRIQAAFRRHRAQVIHRSAMSGAALLQAAGRRFLAYRQFCASRRAVILLQSAWRGYSVRKFYGFVNRASTIVQSTWRGHHLRQQYLSMMSGSVMAQSIWRGHKCRCHLSTLNRAAISIQTMWRSYQASKISVACIQATIKLQSAWRAHIARRLCFTQRSSAILIQASSRGLIAKSRFSRRLDEMRLSAICIQRAWRGYSARATTKKLRKKEKRRAAMLRRKAEKEAKMAIVIQSLWRHYVARKAFISSIRSVIILQAWTRKNLTLNLLEQQVRSAELLQRLWKCHAARKEANAIRTANEQHYSSKIIQSRWRAYIECCNYRLKRSSAVLVQSVIRKHLARKRFIREVQKSMIVPEDCPPSYEIDPREDAAAHCIQVHYLAWKTQMALMTVECAATTIQRAVRDRLLCSPMSPQELMEWQRMNSAAVVIQRFMRRKRIGTERFQGSRVEQGRIVHVLPTWDKTISWLFPK